MSLIYYILILYIFEAFLGGFRPLAHSIPLHQFVFGEAGPRGRRV